MSKFIQWNPRREGFTDDDLIEQADAIAKCLGLKGKVSLKYTDGEKMAVSNGMAFSYARKWRRDEVSGFCQMKPLSPWWMDRYSSVSI